MHEAFFDVWLPALLEGYDAFRMGGVQRRLVPLLYTVGAGFLASFALLRGPRLHAALALSTAALAGAWIFVVQDKGWGYQTLTGYGLAWMAIALALAGAIQRAPRGSLLVVCATVWLWQPVLERVQGEHIQGPNSLIRKVVQHSEVGDRVLVVSSNAYQSYPGLMIEQREVVSTFLIAWPIPILYADGLPEGRYRTREERSEAERRFATRVRRDLLRKKPQVVILESRPRCGHCARGVSVVGYLEHIGFMKRLRRRYRKVGHAIHCDVWVREEP